MNPAITPSGNIKIPCEIDLNTTNDIISARALGYVKQVVPTLFITAAAYNIAGIQSPIALALTTVGAYHSVRAIRVVYAAATLDSGDKEFATDLNNEFKKALAKPELKELITNSEEFSTCTYNEYCRSN
ncbi:MAG: hypothetical protein ACPGEF_07145, partial [Endozoicomonas sp.]